MDINKVKKGITELFHKYKYIVLILVIGLIFMLLPSFQPESEDTVSKKNIASEVQQDISAELENILCQIKGAGKVRVMITVAQGEQTLYQTDADSSVSDSSTSTKLDTITVTDADRNEVGLIRQVNPPTYLGAIILCEGADDPVIRLNIMDAVSKVTGLGADKISIVKMN